MALPAWEESGLLPPGAHRAEMPDLYDRFVLDAPSRQRRELLFRALTVHLDLLKTIVPAGKAWVNGSFCTRRPLPPDDVDVVIHPADWKALEGVATEVRMRLYGLLTLQDVVVRDPAVILSRLQPVGGALDAFLCYPGHEAVWDERWSRVLTSDGSVVAGQKKGYAEVAW
jgi:Family of unknown function (DUF6932)